MANKGVMNQVDYDVARLYGSSTVWGGEVPFDKDDAKYTRVNIRHWLLRWHQLGQEASRSLRWAEVLCDVTQAIDSLRPVLQDLFELYCVIGYSEAEVRQILEWRGDRTFQKRWTELVNGIARRLLDRRMRSLSTSGIVCRQIYDDRLPGVGDECDCYCGCAGRGK